MGSLSILAAKWIMADAPLITDGIENIASYG